MIRKRNFVPKQKYNSSLTARNKIHTNPDKLIKKIKYLSDAQSQTKKNFFLSLFSQSKVSKNMYYKKNYFYTIYY